jgi:hypothetical protein
MTHSNTTLELFPELQAAKAFGDPGPIYRGRQQEQLFSLLTLGWRHLESDLEKWNLNWAFKSSRIELHCGWRDI